MGQPVKNFVEIEKFYSKELTFILDYINTTVREYFNFNEITPEIFVFSCLEKNDSMLYKSLNTFLNTETINIIHDTLIENERRDTKIGGFIKKSADISAKLKTYLTKSIDELNKTKSKLINTDHILLSILKDEESYISDIFKTNGLNYNIALGLSKNVHDVIEDVLNSDTTDNEEDNKSSENTSPFGSGSKTIIFNGGGINQEQLMQMMGLKTGSQSSEKTKGDKIPFCTNLNKLSQENKLDNLIGREKEINEIFRVLSRRKTNNVILVGESGVGKTQIVYGLSNMIVNCNVPLMFRGKQIWKFNPSEMIAGTTLRGMFEDRMVNMIKSLRNNKKAILFIDDIHTIFSEKSKGDYDTGGIISEIFNDGDIQVIATTTYKGYKTLCDANPDMSKKLQKVTIEKTNIDDCFKILNGIKDKYEEFHKVSYSKELLMECIDLSNRYITEKSLPSSAIDIMDEVGAFKKLNNGFIRDIKYLETENKSIEEKISNLVKNDQIEESSELEKQKEQNKNHLAKLEEEYRKSKKEEIGIDDLYETISNHTGIPVGKLKSSNKGALKNIDKTLKSVIIGQDEAIDAVTRAIKRNKVGLSNPSKPLLTSLFIGESGVGKTFLAKSLAKEIYGDEKYLIRFDMSEYSDKTSVNKLIGSSAGYVGYSEGGLLTEAVKNNKYCVLLIDEIEKANEEVYNLLLQVLDEGFLTDNTGNKVNFKNTIILLTSNVGTKKASQTHAFGFDGNDNLNRKTIIEKELKDKFPPEFINRLDEIVYFNALSEDNLKEIIKLELNKLDKKLIKLNYSLEYDNNVIDKIIALISNDKGYGARPIIRVIQNEIENRITDLIIDNDYDGHKFIVSVIDNEINVK